MAPDGDVISMALDIHGTEWNWTIHIIEFRISAVEIEKLNYRQTFFPD